jgi:hypothetical protein
LVPRTAKDGGVALTVRHLDEGSSREYGGVNLLEAYEARRGTVVRVREGHWKAEFAGMYGTIQACWGQSEHAAVDVLLEGGRSELFWLPDLAAVDEDIAV